ncbi:hypothetical protein EV426DRAFT_625169 [Tirmania nivea]|nr:hypothetical protein EV426DRAFT_625169 [Tirmania nivea]
MPRPTKQKRACRAATLASQIARQRENRAELELLELEDLEQDVLEVQENMEEDQLEALDEELAMEENAFIQKSSSKVGLVIHIFPIWASLPSSWHVTFFSPYIQTITSFYFYNFLQSLFFLNPRA